MNYEFKYRLRDTNIIEYYDYLAIHDKTLHKKMVTLEISISILFFVLSVWAFGVNVKGFILAAIAIVLVIVGFPKIFWAIIFKRIVKKVELTRVQYKDIFVKFAEEIEIKDGTKLSKLTYKQIKNIDFTQSNMLIFYTLKDEKLNTLILPMSKLETNFNEFYDFIQKEIK